MNFYREAAVALRQNARSVMLFFAIGAIVGAADSVFQLFVLKPEADAPDRTLGLGLVAWQIFSVAVTSVANTVIFARIGREMDKPMWRVPDDRDAMNLFFKLWFLLGLLLLVYVHGIGALLPAQPDIVAVVMYLASAFTFATLLNVFGSFVMFYGKAGRQEVREAFTTMGHHVGVIIAICLLGVFVGVMLRDTSLFVLGMATATKGAPWYQSLPSIAVGSILGGIDAAFGCFIFAYAWLVCIFHRDHFEQSGDDFDF